MLNKEIINTFYAAVKLFTYGGDSSYYPMINNKDFFIKKFHTIDNETLLYCNYIYNKQAGIVISDWGIRVHLSQSDVLNFPWHSIKNIKKFGNNIQLVSGNNFYEFPLEFIQLTSPYNISSVLDLLRNLSHLDLLNNTSSNQSEIVQESNLTEVHRTLSLVEIFEQNKNQLWWKGRNVGDSVSRPNITTLDESSLRHNFNIQKEETILYFRDTSFWDNKNQGCVVTDWGIHAIPDNDNPSNIIEFSWEYVADVTLEQYIFYFWGSKEHDIEDYACLPWSYFFKGDNINEHDCELLRKLFQKLVDAAVPHKHPALVVLEEMESLEDSDPQKAWVIGTEILGKYPDWENAILFQLGSLAYNTLEDDDKAWKMLTNFLKQEDPTGRAYALASYWCSNIMYKNDSFSPAVRTFLFYSAKGDKELKFNDDVLLWEHAQNELRGLEKEYFGENLSERPYAERKLIFPVNNLFNLSTISHDQVMPVELDSLLANSNLQFPLSHPQANQLYVAHPYNPNVYLLYDNYEIEILQDKLRELSEIAQSLGATEIDVKVISSHGSRNENKGSMSQSGRVEHWTQTNIGASQDTSYSRDEEINFEHMFNRHQTFAPKSTISQPTNTIWLQGEPSWQRLIKQRLEGGLTSHREVIETKSSRVISGTASNQLKGEIESIFADLHLNWNKKEESRYSEHSNLVLSVDIKFSNIQPGNQTLPPSVPNSMTTEELEYKEEYEACLADGIIAASERRLLDRLASKLGLSPEQVKRIEEGIGNPLTDEEKEYLDEYRACLADDPELSSSTRRLLSKMAKSLGLTEEQVNKLENLK